MSEHARALVAQEALTIREQSGIDAEGHTDVDHGVLVAFDMLPRQVGSRTGIKWQPIGLQVDLGETL